MNKPQLLPPQIIKLPSGLIVVSDQDLIGGTKSRAIHALIKPGIEYVYPSSAEGHGQIAAAYIAPMMGATATIFTAHRAEPHANTQWVASLNASVHQRRGRAYLGNVEIDAEAYVEASKGRELLPFGMDHPDFIAALADAARGTGLDPRGRVFCPGGSGVLSRALQSAWPRASKHFVVSISPPKDGTKKRRGRARVPDFGNAEVLYAPEKFKAKAKHLPPPEINACLNYDAKVWRFFEEHGEPGDVWWNVAAELEPPTSGPRLADVAKVYGPQTTSIAVAVDVAGLPELAALVATAIEEHQMCLGAASLALYHARDVGRALLKAKDSIPHGTFMSWVKKTFKEHFTYSSANEYMKIAETWDLAHFENARAENPRLSIDAALHIVCNRKPRKRAELARKLGMCLTTFAKKAAPEFQQWLDDNWEAVVWPSLEAQWQKSRALRELQEAA